MPTQQEICDRIQAEARARAKPLFRPPPERPPPLTPTGDPVSERLSQEVAYVQRLLETLGDTLSADPIILNRHMRALQQFDVIGQVLGHLATIIGTDQREEAITRVGMGELRARLTRKAL